MAYVIADPDMMTAAATDLATIGANVNAAHRPSRPAKPSSQRFLRRASGNGAEAAEI
jgi:PE family protein